jgi:hypothetical protein
MRDTWADEIGAEKIVRIHSAGETMDYTGASYRDSLPSAMDEAGRGDDVAPFPQEEQNTRLISNSRSGVINYSASEENGGESESRRVFEEALRWAETLDDKQHSPVNLSPAPPQRERIRTTGSSGGRKGGLAAKTVTYGSTTTDVPRIGVRYADEIRDFSEDDGREGKILMSQTTSSIDRDKDRERAVNTASAPTTQGSYSSPDRLASGDMPRRELKRRRLPDDAVGMSSGKASHYSDNPNIRSDAESFQREIQSIGAHKNAPTSSGMGSNSSENPSNSARNTSNFVILSNPPNVSASPALVPNTVLDSYSNANTK